MGESPNPVRFAFQPLYSLNTGGVVALEALARPPAGQVRDLLAGALRKGRLVQVDITLAAQAVDEEARHQTLLPLHLNVTACTAAAPAAVFDPLLKALANIGRRPREVVLEVGPPFHGVAQAALREGMQRLAELGFRLAFDGLGRGDLPLDLLASTPVDLVKLDRTLLNRLPEEPAAVAVIEGLTHYASRMELRLVATGIENTEQLTATRRLGVRIAQGNLLKAAGESGSWTGPLSPATPEAADQTGPIVASSGSTPRVADFLRPATTLPATATCEEVRDVLVDNDAPTGIVGLDEQQRPQWSIDRSRFLIAVTGPYGHALHAKRSASRLADPPHMIRADAGALELLNLVNDADWGRTGDDVVVTDGQGRCLGVVLVTEVVRGVAESKIEEAAALSPLTRLPGSDTLARDVDRRIAGHEAMVVAWLDIDAFKVVNDTVGFAAGDDLIRDVGRALTELVGDLDRLTVSHVGGDDFLLACEVDEIAVVANRMLDATWTIEGMTITVSLASLACASGSISSYREVSRMLAPLKKRAKDVGGSSWVLGRPGSERVEVLRGLGRHGLDTRRPAS
ncbi:GGDEF domain-containing protein [Amycolatopsis cihanbeyliensis]|uniref:Diguanylate cyclase/phosphodiesterase n=1 Tax=Amycolatopsis cihanbeyliensis TaxID=1128664 RepID=A0A542CST6_AMYCI|nr:GGDEF domain-containing protein [Amycolatopsis cihanbeyliensis]TQI93844.1 diguanylate cyclase/phosphodiesterase [Amycolatopsis cihanbeyliensis]